MIRCASWMLALALVGCDNPFQPDPPSEAVPWEPPAHYAALYADLEACTGISRSFASIEWHLMPGVSAWESTATGVRVHAEWWPPNEIYIAENRLTLASADNLAMHEALHYNIQDRAHPQPPFETCAPLRP